MLRTCALALTLLIAATARAAEPPTPPPPKAATYPQVLAELALQRQKLSGRYQREPKRRPEILHEARATLLDSLTRSILPAWYGTAWDFNGTSQKPGQGLIACGYFVSTVLRDAGLKVARVRLAQQASEDIVKTLVPAERVIRLQGVPLTEVAARAAAEGDGLYVIGLDFHVGLLKVGAGKVEFCHSSYLVPRAVVCEPAATSPGLASDYFVLGDALADARMVDWLLQRDVPTVGTHH